MIETYYITATSKIKNKTKKKSDFLLKSWKLTVGQISSLSFGGATIKKIDS